MELLFLGCQGVTWIVLEVCLRSCCVTQVVSKTLDCLLHPDYHCTKQEEPIDTTVDFLMIKNHVFFFRGYLGCRKQLSDSLDR